MHAIWQRIQIGTALVSAALLITGCGGNENLCEVTGTVTLDGTPLNEAFITFHNQSGGTTTFGKTNADGHYRMMFDNTTDGAWKGSNLVRIHTGDVPSLAEPAKPERVPDVYHSKSTVTVDVQPGKNVFDFDLKSDAGKITQPREGI